MIKDILLISSLSTFMGSLYPFVLKPMLSSSFNSLVPFPLLSRESIFKRAIATGIYSTKLFYTFWLVCTNTLRLQHVNIRLLNSILACRSIKIKETTWKQMKHNFATKFFV